VSNLQLARTPGHASSIRTAAGFPPRLQRPGCGGLSPTLGSLMIPVFSGNRQSQMPLAPEARISAFLATRKAPPIGNLQASVSCPARLGRFRSAAVVRSFVPVSSALPVAGALSLARRFPRCAGFCHLSRGLSRFSSSVLLAEPLEFSVRGSVTVVGQPLRQWPKKSFNPTAGYGLSRSRKPSVAAGYLQPS